MLERPSLELRYVRGRASRTSRVEKAECVAKSHKDESILLSGFVLKLVFQKGTFSCIT